MKNVFFLCLCFLLSACAGGVKNIHDMRQGSFIVQKYPTSTFTLYGLLRPSQRKNTLHVYIEGDGRAWLSRTRPSNNPTPNEETAYALARHDPSGASVLYLARPCQYVENIDKHMCSKKYWTSHRLAPEVISALSEAIDKAKKDTQAEHVALVGFSGGGGAAVLVAAKRSDVIFLGSVAGLLDHKAWTSKHKITPLNGSLNPLDSIAPVKNIPQRHIMGTSDTIIPSSVNELYCQKLMQKDACKTVPNFTHTSAWYAAWDYAIMP